MIAWIVWCGPCLPWMPVWQTLLSKEDLLWSCAALKTHHSPDQATARSNNLLTWETDLKSTVDLDARINDFLWPSPSFGSFSVSAPCFCLIVLPFEHPNHSQFCRCFSHLNERLSSTFHLYRIQPWSTAYEIDGNWRPSISEFQNHTRLLDHCGQFEFWFQSRPQNWMGRTSVYAWCYLSLHLISTIKRADLMFITTGVVKDLQETGPRLASCGATESWF